MGLGAGVLKYFLGPSIAGQVYDGYMNRKETRRQNEASRRHSDNRYNQTRKDALADFQMTNKYNSPQQQMQRLKEAGLNPHLVYGKGATQVAQQPKQSTSSAPKFEVPTHNLGAGMSEAAAQALSAMQLDQQAQINKANITTQNANALKLMAETDKTLSTTKTIDFDLNLKNTLKDATIENANAVNNQINQNIENLKATEANTRQNTANSIEQIKLNKTATRNDVKRLVLEQNRAKIENTLKKTQTAKTKTEIYNLRQQRKIMVQDTIYKKWENELAKRNLTKNDPVAMRLFKTLLNIDIAKNPGKYNNSKSWQDNKGAMKSRGE